MRELDSLSLVRRVSVARPPGRYESPAAGAMSQALREVAVELSDEARVPAARPP